MNVRWVAALAIVVLVVACSSKNPQGKFFAEVASLSKEEIMARGDALVAKKQLVDARKYYSFLADSFPNDPLGRQAALKVADTYYRTHDVEGLTEARLRYKDFANRFPNDPEHPYALLMLGKCSYQQSKGPLRDLAPVHEALASFKQVVEQFPESTYASEARELLAHCLEDLGQHEFLVARYYYNIGDLVGTRLRLQYLLANYPDTQAARDGKQLLTTLGDRGVVPPPPPPAPTPTPSVPPYDDR
jgi:outer membrane protein assembly factor BamD